VRAHWGVDDPSHVVGTPAQIDAAFDHAWRLIRTRIEAFLALPLAQLAANPAVFKAELDNIGNLQLD